MGHSIKYPHPSSMRFSEGALKVITEGVAVSASFDLWKIS